MPTTRGIPVPGAFHISVPRQPNGPLLISHLLGIALWLVMMLALEVGFGRLVFRASWQRILADFDPRQGGLLAIGMCILFDAPILVAKLRGLI